MATKRRKGIAWEYCVRSKLLPRPVWLRFRDEADGDAYVARLEQLLAAGIVPPEFLRPADAPRTIGQAIDAYTTMVSVRDCDERVLITLGRTLDKVALATIDYPWAEHLVKRAKQVEQLAPNTIRQRVGALARMFDWLCRRGDMVTNPLRLLPKGYASYTAGDAAVLAALDQPVRADQSRDRRLLPGEEAAIRRIFAFEKPEGKERALALPERAALLLLFDLALESAMRLRECYSIDIEQIDLARRTIFLDKTKNGDSRQVPLSSVILPKLATAMAGRTGLLFPWWGGQPSQAELRRVTALLSRQFARIFAAAGCPDLHFHDLRHEATSRLFEKTALSEFEIAKITGHRSPRMLMRYANLRGSDLAAKLW